MKTYLPLIVLALSALACGGQTPRRLELYPTITVLPTQTERVLILTQTPNATYTPVVIVVSQTPASGVFCVSAAEAVYLRPSPAVDNYPIATIRNGSKVRDLGGRSDAWVFVAIGNESGWVNSIYLSDNCETQ